MPDAPARRAVAGALIAALAFAAPSMAQPVYRWVDEKGVTHFSEQPPPDGRKATRLELKTSPGASSPTRGTSYYEERERPLRERRLEQEKKDDAERARRDREDQDRRGRCDKARERVEILSQRAPVYFADEKGDRTYISDEERARLIREANGVIDRDCDRR